MVGVPHEIPDDFIERCDILKISIPRGLFLLKCPHASNPITNKRGAIAGVEYDPRVLLAEAQRLGLGWDAIRFIFKSELTVEQIAAMGYEFPAKSAYPPPPGRGFYSLFQWEPHHDEKKHRRPNRRK